MECLLTSAERGVRPRCSTTDWKLCVHSLNVLKLLVADAVVGPALHEHISRVMQCCMSGFESARWAVRNSSMMVFTSVVQRAVDADKNDSGGASAGYPDLTLT
jgi:hypothetical protein